MMDSSGKTHISFTNPTIYWAGIDSDNVVVFVYNLQPYIHDPSLEREWIRWHSWRNKHNWKEVCIEECETLATICDIPVVDIRNFTEWENENYFDIENIDNHVKENEPQGWFSVLSQKCREVLG